ncbi:MAG: hypothetical protein H4O13_16155 [Xanthomonadales bacterium]|nr:hypothetical protein [Xanthomonadales bacterium]
MPEIMVIPTEEPSGFAIYLDFAKSEGRPSRVFQSMALLVDTFAALDKQLVGVFGRDAATELVLEEITAGSIRSRLRNVLSSIPDGPLSELDAKKIIGHFLVKAKYRVIEWLGKNEKIESIQQVRALEGELQTLAERTGVREIPAYEPISTDQLLEHLNQLQIAVHYLDERDVVFYESPMGKVEIPRGLHIDEVMIREILTSEILASEDTRIVKVKKPDYLGRSKWAFKYSGHSIEAAIADHDWLVRFQNGEESVRPGDSLRVRMRQEVSYGHTGEVVHVVHTVLHVIEVVPPTRHTQSEIDF